MSADLRDFAAAFNQSYQHASASAIAAADKAQQRAIQMERNKIIDQRNQANARRDDIKLGLYAESVHASSELARARAQKALQPKGGGGGGPAASGGTPDEVDKRLANVGLTLDKPAPPPQVNVSVTGGGNDGGPDVSPGAPPESTPVQTEARGGMVRKMASGGTVGDMSLGQAESYESRDKTDSSTPATATSAFTSGLSSGAAAATKGEDKDKDTRKPTTPQPATRPPTAIVPNVSPDLSGTGETYRRGGAVRRYADGGVASAIPNLETQGPQAIQYAPPPSQPVAPQYSGPSGSANAATGSGGDAAGGVSGSGGIGGSASAGEGGSAAAGTSGGAADAGDGGGTYRRGGRVRRFQSGGRVMEAIDTGTSGPSSGFGYRAPPPMRR